MAAVTPIPVAQSGIPPSEVLEKTVHETQLPITEADEASLQRNVTASSIPLQRWNHPRSNIFRVFSSFWCFLILGANDAAYGALIPYLETYYDVDYLTISLVFLSPIVGYTLSALTNNTMHMKFGQRGVAAIMGFAHLIAYLIISFHPPYPALVVVFSLAGYGNGLGDSAWNAWVGAMENSNEVLGFLHGFYGLGATISPLIATTLITRAGWKWYQFYYLLIGASLIEIVMLTASFWTCTASVYRAQHQAAIDATERKRLEYENNTSGTITPTDADAATEKHQATSLQRFNPFSPTFFMNPPHPSAKRTTPPEPPSRLVLALRKLNPRAKSSSSSTSSAPSTTYRAISNRVTLLTATFLLLYVGAEVSQGGWLISFLIDVRGAQNFQAGMAGTGFWLGVTVGRLILGFVTARCFPTEKHAVACYLLLAIVAQVLFWAIPSFLVSAVMAGVLGFLIAPFFPCAVVMLAKNLPSDLHVAAVGFSAAVGASGATVLPFAVGAIAQSKGVQVLQPIILALLVAIFGVWLLMPSLAPARKAKGNGNKEEK